MELMTRSRYEEGQCVGCGEMVTLDFGPEGYDGDPIEVSTAADHGDDCPDAPAPQVIESLAICVRRSESVGEWSWFAFVSPNPDGLQIGLVYGSTAHEAGGKMLGILDDLGILSGRTIPITFMA